MREIVVISGKGGTGKTSVTASLAYLGGEDVIVADCDVDAADMHLLMQPDFADKHDFYSGELAVLDQNTCIQCGQCLDVCRFDAVSFKNNRYYIDPLSCEGCGYCSRVCPAGAIENQTQLSGEWFVSNIRTNTRMVHAKLGIGADNSGKLVAKVKNQAKEIAKADNKKYIIVDGAPGIGCPVVSSLSGAKLVVLVTEPTVSGIHDLKRVYQLVKKFKINAACIINKHDLNSIITDQIEEFCKSESIPVISEIPYNENFTKAMTVAKTIVEYDNGELKECLQTSWHKIQNLL